MPFGILADAEDKNTLSVLRDSEVASVEYDRLKYSIASILRTAKEAVKVPRVSGPQNAGHIFNEECLRFYHLHSSEIVE